MSFVKTYRSFRSVLTSFTLSNVDRDLQTLKELLNNKDAQPILEEIFTQRFAAPEYHFVREVEEYKKNPSVEKKKHIVDTYVRTTGAEPANIIGPVAQEIIMLSTNQSENLDPTLFNRAQDDVVNDFLLRDQLAGRPDEIKKILDNYGKQKPPSTTPPPIGDTDFANLF